MPEQGSSHAIRPKDIPPFGLSPILFLRKEYVTAAVQVVAAVYDIRSGRVSLA